MLHWAKVWLVALLGAAVVACGGSGGGAAAAQFGEFRVTSVTPHDQSQGVGLTSEINVLFSRAVDPATLGTQTLQIVAESGDVIRGLRRVGLQQRGIVRFIPDNPGYVPFALHSIRVSQSIRDTDGNRLDKDYEFLFQTEEAAPILLTQDQIQDEGNVLRQGRWFHRATLLQENKVLVAGGYKTGGSVSDRMEIFDPITRTSSLLGNSLLRGRAGHVQILLDDGRVLLAGGESLDFPFAPLAHCEIYDPATFSTSAAASMKFSRSFAHAARLADGRVLVTGGQDSPGGVFVFRDDAEIYDTASDTWTLVPDAMRSARAGHFSARVAGGDVVVIGGSSSVPGSDRFLTGSTAFDAGFETPFVAHLFGAGTVLPDGRPMVVGGASTKGVTLWDSQFGFQSAITLMTAERAFATATAFTDGRVVVAGGTDFSAVPPLLHKTIDVVYEVGSAFKIQRITGVRLPRATTHHEAVRTLDGTIWLLGGLPSDFASAGLRQAVAILQNPPP